MLEPRETDIPALFLVLVVLPLVTYILLGKWSDVSKKKERISLLAQLAAEEAFKAEAMAVATMAPAPAPAVATPPPTTVTFLPLVTLPKNGVHECARCHGPATTRCARCKSVRYCSGKCQIIHWRQFHKQECEQLEYSNCSSPKSEDYSVINNSNERVLIDDDSRCFGYSSIKQPRHEKNMHHEDRERRSSEKYVSRKPKKEMFRREDGTLLEPTTTPSTDAYIKHKLKEINCLVEDEILDKNEKVLGGFSNGHMVPRSSMHDSHKSSQNQNRNSLDSRNTFGIPNSVNSALNGRNSRDMEMELVFRGGINSSDETSELKKSNKSKMYKSPKSTVKASREQPCLEMDKKGQIADESKFARTRDTVLPQGINGVTSMGIKKMIGLMRSSKPDRFDSSEHNGDKHKKIKMLFPYEEFVKFFQCEVFYLSPRGLVNCGNSCYANAVLQCLACTKPLTIYLLSRSHSRACCGKDWCLMCELEQHVMMLRESGGGGPMSPGGILLHMRSLNGQIGGGSQEDAHEFLRLLVTSMQSICLEGLGGENVVDPRLQETTFIQHTFGGRLRSKVKCLRCHHESERYENIMDLTLEIFGWVESLEDALTQFTSAEDLDGENMYRCGRCSAYVRAQKQLSIQEAPNILTIVLKRFQEGSYGKINKCITFPDMLDMIPYMTGTDDIPPLYMLYAVVVHLDTLNASFSGHYISYVKDLQGNWFRIDDTEVQSVPASQVMSEGAYILFYMRSCPRPAHGKPTRHNASSFAKHWTSKTAPKSSRSGHSKSSCHLVSPDPSLEASRNMEVSALEASRSVEFSDATSSDRSFFTSSDEASFTTESTRDSFSTVDYADAVDPFSSIFNTLYTPDYSSHKTVSCSRVSRSRPHSRFVLSEGKSSVMDSIQGFPSEKSIYVKYHSSKDGTRRNSCIL